MSLTLCALLGLWSLLGDCAASLFGTSITATPARGIIYSSTGCTALHTLLIFIWARGWWRQGMVFAGGGLLRGLIWIFHCFQHFLLLVGQIQMEVNGGNVKCIPHRHFHPLSLSLPLSVPACSPVTATHFLLSMVLLTCQKQPPFPWAA